MVSLKHKGYWLTFMAYAAIHALRMCYSFNKVNLKRHFGLSQFYLGFLDAILYLSYSFGVLIRYWVFEGNQLMTKTYFITSMMISLFFGFIAYVALFSEISAFSYLLMKILLTVGVFGFGFFHFTAYQICGSIVSGFYDAKHKKGEIGFWGSNSSVGNIVGFFISNYIIHQLNLRWEVSFFLFAIINLITAFAMYFWLTMPEEDQSYKQQLYLLPHLTQKTSNQQIQQIQKSIERQIRPIHWFKFIQKLISTSIEARYLYVAYITMKATVYTFLMWFPIFLVSKNLESVSGYISTLFDLGGCAGGYLLGKLHATANQYDELPHHQKNSFLGVILRYRNIVFIIIIATIIILFMILPSSLALYCPLTFFIGFFLGGQFNNISSHQIFSLGENHLLYTDMLLNTSVGVSCFLIGIVQLLTAFLLKWDQKHKKQKEAENYGVFFVVLLIMMVLCGVMTFGRIKVSKKYLEDHKK